MWRFEFRREAHLLELHLHLGALLVARTRVAVGVVLQRALLVGLLDLVVRRLARHPQQLVQALAPRLLQLDLRVAQRVLNAVVVLADAG